LFTQHPEFAWGLIASMYIGNVMLVLLNLFANPLFATMLWIPYPIQVAFVVLFAIVGSYSLSNNPFDIVVMIAFGVLGFAMKRLDFSAAGLILGLVLGPLAEKSLRQSLTLSRGDWSIFFTRPVAGVLMVLALSALLWPLARKALIRRSVLPGAVDEPQYTGGEE
jgi:putative tricarboxylic transport membrane protein